MSESRSPSKAVDLIGFDGSEWVLNDPEVLQHRSEPSNEGAGKKDKKAAIKSAIATVLTNVGEYPEREGLVNTPHRVAKMYDEILAGYDLDPESVVNGALFDVEYDEMIVVKDIEFFSLCEHHMVPFYGRAHAAYIPGEKIICLSKIP